MTNLRTCVQCCAHKKSDRPVWKKTFTPTQPRLKNCIILCKSIFYLTESVFEESIAEEMTVGIHLCSTDTCQDPMARRSMINSVYGPKGGQARAVSPLSSGLNEACEVKRRRSVGPRHTSLVFRPTEKYDIIIS